MLYNSLVKNVNPISNQKKPDPSKISQEELPERFDVKDARPPINIVDSIKSSGSFSLQKNLTIRSTHFVCFAPSKLQN
ncbi:hypothetical protein RUM43_005169 [Polyplax serrata]|uniref:Uncharacterized protein n=1 Tax=Polyplax serrata TaxID=468196 RepID=A0AAN8XMN9_POLSC